MHLRAYCATLILTALCTNSARALEYFVAPTGDDSNAGSMAAPFASVERAQMLAAPGDTVWIRGGEYKFSGTSRSAGVTFTKSGSPNRRIHYFAYPGETPVFDLFELKPQARVTGLDVQCSWVHLRGLEVRGVRQIVVGDSWGVRVRGDNNRIEHLHVHDNEAPGVFITSGSNNEILNCDSHHNYDPLESGGNADGFGCHASGEGNVLRGCRAWENSDDGFDFINAAGACTVEGSMAFRNGYIPDTNMAAANGAGFKSGGYGYPPKIPATGAARHVVRFNLAFGNRVIGFYANFHPGEIDFIHNTAFDNPANYDMRTAGTPSSHLLRNNIAAGSGRTIINFDGGSDDFNSWTLPVDVSGDDFLSLDHMLAYAPRLPDGNLPSTSLARLRPGSDLIDRGEDRGSAFSGSAPDLGAFEVGLDAHAGNAGNAGDTDAGAPGPGPSASDATPPTTATSVGTSVSGNSAGTGALAAATRTQPAASASGSAAPAASQTFAGADETAIAAAPETPSSGCGCQVGPRATRQRLGGLGALVLLLGAARRGSGRRGLSLMPRPDIRRREVEPVAAEGNQSLRG